MLYNVKEEEWEKIKNSLHGKEGDRGRSAKDNRRFIAAVMWNWSTMESIAYRVWKMVKKGS